MKRKIALTLAIIMLITLYLPATALANPLQELPGGPTFDIESLVVGFQGEDVTVPVYVRNNPGFSAVGFVVGGYEATQLEFRHIYIPNTDAHVLRDNNYQAGSTWVSLVNPADNNVNWLPENPEEAHHLVDLVFRVLPNAPTGVATVSITWTGTPHGAPTQGTRNPDGSTVLGGVYRDPVILAGSVNVQEARDGIPMPGEDERFMRVHSHGGIGGLTSRNIPRARWEIPTGAEYAPTHQGGLQFLHWSMIAGGPAIPGGAIPEDLAGREVNLHAVWSTDLGVPGLNERRLNVNLNGGVGGLPVQNIPRAAWQIPTGIANSPVREGFDFIGWSLTADGAPITTVPAGDAETTIYALWASQTDQPPPVLEGHRRIVLNAGGGNWGSSPPLDWRRHAPLAPGSNITAIWHDVRVNEAMPTFHTPWIPPAPNMVFDEWSRPRTELMPDYNTANDPGDWASTAEWVESENGDGNGNGDGSNGDGNVPGTIAPPPGVTRPEGAGNIRVIEHFGTWTGSGTRTARVDADHTTFQRLWFGDRLVNMAHLTIGSGSTAITLSEAFISNLSDGTYSFVSEFSGGHATLNLIVSRGFGNVPQTGVADITPTLIIMGIAMSLTISAGVLLYVHIRQKRTAKRT